MGVLARGRSVGEAGRVTWLFTDRLGGASLAPYDSANLGLHVGDDPDAVHRNRIALAAELGAVPLATMSQVHGRVVARAGGDTPEADGLVSDDVGRALVVQVADCVPLLMFDAGSGRIAAVHAGWRGVALDIVGAAVEALESEAPHQVAAWIGPAICPGCYEVGAQVRDEVADVVAQAAAVTRSGTPAVDLRGAVAAQLARYGIAAELVGGCTAEDPTLFSYRRDGVTGRQAGVIVRESA